MQARVWSMRTAMRLSRSKHRRPRLVMHPLSSVRRPAEAHKSSWGLHVSISRVAMPTVSTAATKPRRLVFVASSKLGHDDLCTTS